MPEAEITPVFGTQVEGCPYIVRPSAYAVVQGKSGEVALVRTSVGIYLIGGGIQGGERPEQTVEREAKEECGLLVVPRSVLGKAVDIVHSPRENACFEKRCTFLEVDLHGVTSPEQRDHELIWVDRKEAIALLSHPSHRWAVGTLIV